MSDTNFFVKEQKECKLIYVLAGNMKVKAEDANSVLEKIISIFCKTYDVNLISQNVVDTDHFLSFQTKVDEILENEDTSLRKKVRDKVGGILGNKTQ